ASLEVALKRIETAIGAERFEQLARRYTAAEDIPHRLARLRREGEGALTLCRECEPVPCLNEWAFVSAEWWFDSEYLGKDIQPVASYFECLRAYQALPRYRGQGHKLEAWVESQEVEDKAMAAFSVLAKLCTAQISNEGAS
ncbi:MAG: hypothetical protein Q8P50_04430, partial [Bacillota bacterium]|nr:hypothetical protein [Bacillota bacterium]